MTIPFLKMHGAGNDFVVLDHRRPFLEGALETRVARWCDRRRGIGADGVLLLESDPELDFAMRYFNSDGNAADYCGNGARCLARFALDLGLGSGHPKRVRFRTSAGIQEARALDEAGRFEVHFGRVPGTGEPCALEHDGKVFEGRLIQAGVPHFVTAVERVEWVPVAEWGSALRHHERFGPAGANVDFVTPLHRGRVAMRTYERGVEGETLACGSGAIASALWAASDDHPSPVVVLTAGGDELCVSFEKIVDGFDVTLAGPAEVSYRGEWTDRSVA